MEQIGRILEMDSKVIYFHDMNFTLDRHYTMALCRALIRHKIKIPWACMTRINLVDRELLILLRKAGCQKIFYGVESLCEKVLYSMKGCKYSPVFGYGEFEFDRIFGDQGAYDISLSGFQGKQIGIAWKP